MFQMSGIGPMQGQANHFTRTNHSFRLAASQYLRFDYLGLHLLTSPLAGFADAKYPYSINRYVNETRRLYRVVDIALAKNPHGFLVGDRLTIADIAIWPWLTAYSKNYFLLSPVACACV